MKTQLEKLEFVLHDLRGMLQVLSNFTQCIERDVITWKANGNINNDDLRDDCKIILESLEVIAKNVKEIVEV